MNSNSKLINIGGQNNDPNYRYKRNRIEISVENKNGKQTKLLNIDTIAKQIRSKICLVLDWFKKNMGLPINNNTIGGIVQTDQLEKLLDVFINKFVLCKKCNLPELDMDTQICSACGFSPNDNKRVSKSENKGENKNNIKLIHKDEEEIEEFSNVDPEDIKLSKLMHYLYDLYDMRDKFTIEQVELIEECIERCWDEDIKMSSDRKIRKINKKLEEFGITVYVVEK